MKGWLSTVRYKKDNTRIINVSPIRDVYFSTRVFTSFAPFIASTSAIVEECTRFWFRNAIQCFQQKFNCIRRATCLFWAFSCESAADLQPAFNANCWHSKTERIFQEMIAKWRLCLLFANSKCADDTNEMCKYILKANNKQKFHSENILLIIKFRQKSVVVCPTQLWMEHCSSPRIGFRNAFAIFARIQ